MTQQITEPIVLESTYPFKSHRFPNYRTYIHLNLQQQNEIRKTLRKQYPFGAPGRDVIKMRIQNNSCGYCLCYGHTTDPTIFPPTCPNLPSDYSTWLIEMARKYHADLRIMNFHVMTGVGITSHKHYNTPKWSRYDFEQQLCEKYPRYAEILKTNLNPPRNVFVDNPPKILSKL